MLRVREKNLYPLAVNSNQFLQLPRWGCGAKTTTTTTTTSVEMMMGAAQSFAGKLSRHAYRRETEMVKMYRSSSSRVQLNHQLDHFVFFLFLIRNYSLWLCLSQSLRYVWLTRWSRTSCRLWLRTTSLRQKQNRAATTTIRATSRTEGRQQTCCLWSRFLFSGNICGLMEFAACSNGQKIAQVCG